MNVKLFSIIIHNAWIDCIGFNSPDICVGVFGRQAVPNEVQENTFKPIVIDLCIFIPAQPHYIDIYYSNNFIQIPFQCTRFMPGVWFFHFLCINVCCMLCLTSSAVVPCLDSVF